MSKQYLSHTDSQRLAIRSQVNLASEIIAPYWSISSFVSNNPLYELEYLHFEEALKRGQELRGGRGFLANEAYRSLYSRGRISAQRIDQELASVASSESLTIAEKTVSKTDVFRALMLNEIIAPNYENLSLILERSKDKEAIFALSDKLDGLVSKSSAEAIAQQLATDDSAALSKSISLSQWCDGCLGTRVTQLINEELTRWCAAFVDEGQAAWALPWREKSLYGAWKRLSLLGPGIEAIDKASWRKALEALPDSPEDCILDVLADLGIPESRQKEYFAIHLSSLSGWSGFVKWRAERSGYPWQQAYPADLTQLLAIRLVYERQLVSQLCRQKLGIEGSYTGIQSYMASHPLVYFMLRQRVENKLPVNLAQKIDRRWYQGNAIADWQKLAAEFVKFLDQTKVIRANCSAAWRLSALGNCLNVSVQDLLNCVPENLRILFDWLEQFPEERHGLVWLKAMEADYQEKLLSQISESIADNAVKETDTQSKDLRPQCQAMFCIDVRSEPFRRHLEAVGQNETLGFAGFFICFIRFQAFGSNHETDQFPVIMKARNIVREVPRPYQHHKMGHYAAGSELLRIAKTLLHNLKEHVITPFVTVESIGWFYSLPFFFKTLAAVPYRNFSHGLKKLVEAPVSTILTIDKLPPSEAKEMVVGNQNATIRSILQDRFSISIASADLIEALRRLALNEESPDSLDTVRQHLPNLSKEEIDAFVEDLSSVHRVSARGTSSQMERITRTGFTLEEQVFTIETALKMMGLTTNFARVIMVCAHGSTSDNNPYESALDCGACGGNDGQANARAFAAMANKVQVREELAKKGIVIPNDTHFVPAQINTTTDEVELLDLEDAPTTHRLDLARLTVDLEQASRLTSAERCLQFPELSKTLSPQQSSEEVIKRSRDWSQVRPEWGLSGNASFIIARREITKAINLDGRSFLHSYDYLTDPGGKLLEILMTAPQVVTQWINMQYYFSVVDNDSYGSGSKVYHNVAAHIGVMSGTASDLRTGLPWQTVMSGGSPYHEPLRLTTLVEAPRPTIDLLIGRHELLRRFYHNEWVHLIALDREEGKFYRYSSAGEWQQISASSEARVIKMQQTVTSTLQ
jgi:uncharacterized protein